MLFFNIFLKSGLMKEIFSGKFITFEGPEGAGKTTQIQLAAQAIEKYGVPCLLTREPGGTPLAEELRNIIKHYNGDEKISPETELLLIEAARSQHVKHKILPALAEGKCVLCDRFTDSTCAYQGGGRHMDMKNIRILNEFAIAPLKINATILMKLDIKEGFKRTRVRYGDKEVFDRFESQNLEFHQNVMNGFLQIAESEQDRVAVVDASRSIEEIHQNIMEALHELLQ